MVEVLEDLRIALEDDNSTVGAVEAAENISEAETTSVRVENVMSESRASTMSNPVVKKERVFFFVNKIVKYDEDNFHWINGKDLYRIFNDVSMMEEVITYDQFLNLFKELLYENINPDIVRRMLGQGDQGVKFRFITLNK